MIDRVKIEHEFRRIKKLGYLKSKRSHNTGIGKTFEDYLGVDENNNKDPDFAGFEVKTQRQMTSSYITLFTKSPSHPKGANATLKDTFGKPDNKFPKLKVLHTSLFGNKYNTYLDKYRFKLYVNSKKKRVYFNAKLIGNDKIIANDVYWTFDDLHICINKKLKALFVVIAESRQISGKEYFHYTKAKVFYNLKFKKFIKALKSGSIMFDIRIGAYKSGNRYGKPHDHGSGFRIKRENIREIFDLEFDIK